MTALRAGLIGLGSMGRHHARILREIEGVELVVLVDAGGDPYGVAADVPVLDDVGRALDSRLDFAVVAVPTIAHESVAGRLADAGVGVLVEKPLAPSVEACLRLVAEFERKGAYGAVGHVERFNPAVREMKRLIGSGAIGAVRQVSTRRQGPFPARISDVGVGLDLAVHDVDLSSWLAGARYDNLFAQAWTAPGQAHEGILNLLGTMSDGSGVSNTVNWHSALRERIIVVSGDDGVLVADTGTSTLRVFRGTSGDGDSLAVTPYEPLRAELEAFRDAILGMPTELATFADGLACVTVVEAALGSASTGQPVRLDRPSAT